MSNTGFRVYLNVDRPDPSLVERFGGIAVASIADSMNRASCISGRIKPLNRAPLLGVAVTVKTRPGDSLVMQKAMNLANPGDVIVVDAQGATDNANAGELIVTWMQHRKLAGLIVDGAVRDVGAIRNMTFPVYAAGITPRGPYKDGPGEVNVPISCGGVTVKPGDIVVGDEDGVVIVNPHDGEDVLGKVKHVLAREAKLREEIPWDGSWVDEVLKEKGCEFIGTQP
ncbi:RraA family protein [Bradyrhizobium sp. 76]|uniref:RraA family protein n=1 Tax=Bradyrhizobium sp. 76 TaxID=2782680 RepID=UPI001FF927C1|nr:RraA family protein [Bradyrhizobium sp. 76]MCK1406897.1 RraA family protein [Bradyrhizobium sp. 76]